MSVKARRILALAAAFGVALPACGPSARERRQDRIVAAESAETLASRPGLLVGEFSLAADGVVDGDTIKVVGLKESIRLVNVDTEETFKSATDRALFAAGWESYLESKKGDSRHPVKMATPLGEEAKTFAKEFFGKGALVRLERDHPRDLRDRYQRHLGYAFVLKDGRWVNYNVECVRAGMSPYFSKYGYSRRFHAEFVAAQQEAREARRGIWDPAGKHYPDYADRLLWWNARGDFVRAFEKEAGDREDWIDLAHWDSLRLLRKNLGKRVHVLGVVGTIEGEKDPPIRVHLARRRGSDLPVTFFDERVFVASGIARFKGEYVAVAGRVNEYEADDRRRPRLEVVVDRVEDVSGPVAALKWSGAEATSPGEVEGADGTTPVDEGR
ncbi:MAG: thermonuclease family protein [Deltaproteobacteria bacterium]|nr:thermonuclease family protein [Deltaproteobacteria bacterium]